MISRLQRLRRNPHFRRAPALHRSEIVPTFFSALRNSQFTECPNEAMLAELYVLLGIQRGPMKNKTRASRKKSDAGRIRQTTRATRKRASGRPVAAKKVSKIQ